MDGTGAKDSIGFVTVTSDFALELEAYYEEEVKEWLASLRSWSQRPELGGRRGIRASLEVSKGDA